MEPERITVDRGALHQVLQALVGPGHLIRELQATRSLHAFGHPNPIETLVAECQAQQAAALAAPAAAIDAREQEADPGFTTKYPLLNDLLQETFWLGKGPNNHDTGMAWFESLERFLEWLASRQEAPVARGGLPTSQEPKYTVNGTHIVNRHSGEAVPHDEPVFVFRARDALGVQALEAYVALIGEREPSSAHADAVRGRIADFQRFAVEHAERIKWPDTAHTPSEALSPATVAQPVEWGDPKTVGMFVRQLQTIAPETPIHAAVHTDLDGKRVALTKPVTISRERVQGRRIRQGDQSVPYSIVVWASHDEAAQPWMEQEAKYEAQMRETHAALQADDTPLETGEGDAR